MNRKLPNYITVCSNCSREKSFIVKLLSFKVTKNSGIIGGDEEPSRNGSPLHEGALKPVFLGESHVTLDGVQLGFGQQFVGPANVNTADRTLSKRDYIITSIGPSPLYKTGQKLLSILFIRNTEEILSLFWTLYEKCGTQIVFLWAYSVLCQRNCMWIQKNIVSGMGWTWVAGSTWDFPKVNMTATNLEIF